jgi:hypothetical protein
MPQITTATADALDSIDASTDQARAVLRLVLDCPAPVDPETLAGALHCLDRLLGEVSEAMEQIQRDPALVGALATA